MKVGNEVIDLDSPTGFSVIIPDPIKSGRGGYGLHDFSFSESVLEEPVRGRRSFRIVAHGPGGVIAGCADYTRADDRLTLEHVEVEAEFRRCRLATALVFRVMWQAKQITGGPLQWTTPTTPEGAALRARIDGIEAMVASLCPADQVRVELSGGKVWDGEVRDGPFVYLESHDRRGLVILHHSSPDYATVSEITVTRKAHEVLEERQKRKFGKWAHPDPVTRDDFERVLYALACEINQLRDRGFGRTGFDADSSRRARELEAQFHAVADRIDLAKTKRNYIICFNFKRRSAGLPDMRRSEFNPLRNSYDVPAAVVPKPLDFDPLPEIRARRAPRPPEDYTDRSEVEWCLADAKRRVESRKTSKEKREHFAALVARHEAALSAGDYYEAKAEEHNQMMQVGEPVELPEDVIQFNSVNADRRGIRNRLKVFRSNLDGLREQVELSPEFACRNWAATRRGIQADSVLNDAEKRELIAAGDAIVPATTTLSR